MEQCSIILEGWAIDEIVLDDINMSSNYHSISLSPIPASLECSKPIRVIVGNTRITHGLIGVPRGTDVKFFDISGKQLTDNKIKQIVDN